MVAYDGIVCFAILFTCVMISCFYLIALDVHLILFKLHLYIFLILRQCGLHKQIRFAQRYHKAIHNRSHKPFQWPKNMFYCHKTFSMAVKHVLLLIKHVLWSYNQFYGHGTWSMAIERAPWLKNMIHGHRTCYVAHITCSMSQKKMIMSHVQRNMVRGSVGGFGLRPHLSHHYQKETFVRLNLRTSERSGYTHKHTWRFTQEKKRIRHTQTLSTSSSSHQYPLPGQSCRSQHVSTSHWTVPSSPHVVPPVLTHQHSLEAQPDATASRRVLLPTDRAYLC